MILQKYTNDKYYVILPSLLTNAGKWVEITDETISMLNSIQDTFGRSLLALPMSAPRASLWAALGLIGMKWRVLELKLHLGQAMKRQDWPGRY